MSAHLAHGKRLLDAAFSGTWRYTQFRISCDNCDGYTNDVDCTNPECDGDSVPSTFVEAPEAYPASDKHPQVVATIEVPGISDLAERNGEAICWLKNNGPQLIADAEELAQLKAALTWLMSSDEPNVTPVVLEFAKSLGWNP